MTTTAESVAGTRYSWGGDDHIFVELDEEMSLPANFRVMAITRTLRDQQVAGVSDVCPANASYQVRYDPDVVDPHALVDRLRRLDDEVGDAHDFQLSTRIVEIPVLYQDPWTQETLMRFRDRHQNPDGTDIEFAARINGLSGPDAFIEAHSGSPWFTSMVGFVAGLPFLFQMVARERQLEVPKYLRPRTDTPALTIGHGGCFGCIYSVRGAGGYQMFGITPAPIYDPTQQLEDFRDFVCFFRPGDIVKFTPIDRATYDATRQAVQAGTFRIRQRPVGFSLQPFLEDPDGYNAALLGCSVQIEVLQPGLSTTVQDQGRVGYYDVGIPPSGALDQYSLLAANLLVGNPEDAAALECVYLGPQLRFTAPGAVAVTGAQMIPKLNGEERPQWEAFPVAEGDVLEFAYLTAGARAYIGIAGGIDVAPVLGSRSTYALGAMGGHEGRPLREGDQLATIADGKATPGRAVPRALLPELGPSADIRVVMGLYDHRLTTGGRRTFLETEWTLTPVADRIGFRYKGAELEFVERKQPFGAGSDPSNIVDAPYPIGSIQIPGGVEPIILHRDAVSGGGYAMVATVISSDLDRVGQSAPNTKTRFVEVDLDGALAARKEYKARIGRLREALA